MTTTTKKNITKPSYIRHTVQDKHRTWIILPITMIRSCLSLCCLCRLLIYDPCPRWSFVVNWPVDASIIIFSRILRRSLVVRILVLPGIVILIIFIREVVVCGPNNTVYVVRMPPHHPQSDTHNQPIQAQGGPHPPTGSFRPSITNACGSSPSFTSSTSSIHRHEAGVCCNIYS